MGKFCHLYYSTEAHDAARTYDNPDYHTPWVSATMIDGVVGDNRYNLPHNYAMDYLTFEALEDNCTFTFTFQRDLSTNFVKSFSYSVDGGDTWVTTNNVNGSEVTVTTPAIDTGETILFKGDATAYYDGNNMAGIDTSSTGEFNAYGNIMSLLYGDDFAGQDEIESPYAFCAFFGDGFDAQTNGFDHLVSAENLSLPATTLANHCYDEMFCGCTSLTTAPALPATTLANYCYAEMFEYCAALTTPPALPATTLAEGCYGGMFEYCTTLTTAPELPATTLAIQCYNRMFQNCTALVTTPSILPAATLAQNCYINMFWGCTSLTIAPALPATTLAQGCYYCMFWGCTSLTIAPELPATTLAQSCYYEMFRGCTSLTTAPELPATTLASASYNNMFYGCSNLNYIKALFTTTPSSTYTNNWVQGVASTGTFVKNASATWNVTGTNGVPTGWTVQTDHLAFEALESGTFTFTNALEYSTNDGSTWTSLAANTATPTVNTGNKIMFRASLTPSSSTGVGTFSSTGRFNASGNPLSLLYGNNFDTVTSLSGKSYALYKLFQGCTNLVSAGDLMLKATTLAGNCYRSMFYGCTALTTAPALPATTLKTGCYAGMFNGCTSLTNAPVLPATTLADQCYSSMFVNCTSLTTAPELPATTMTRYCYNTMFSGCTSLTNAPVLPATTLENYCYSGMFSHCTALTVAPSILPATTLTQSCYNAMFWDCTSLTRAPVLPATTLVTSCYVSMFQDCSSLNYIKAMFTTEPSNTYNGGWLTGVASYGTFVKNSAASWNVAGVNGVPSGWTVQTASS